MTKHSILILGNKPYVNLNLNDTVNSFGTIRRCNFAIPERNNGNLYGELHLCSHMSERLIDKPISRNEFVKFYMTDYKQGFLESYYDFFEENKHKFDSIKHANFRTEVFNNFLKENNSPYSFSKIPRTGYTVIFESILEKRHENICVFGFSVSDNIRRSHGSLLDNSESEGNGCHSKNEEISILKWLHKNEYIDATLCLLQDELIPTLDCSILKPSKFTLDLIKETCGDYKILNLENRIPVE